MKSKMELYETAFWVSIGHYVKLVKYHKRFNYYDVLHLRVKRDVPSFMNYQTLVYNPNPATCRTLISQTEHTKLGG